MAAMKQQTYPDPYPVELPAGLDAWLLDCAPERDCEVCQSEYRLLHIAKQRGDIAQATKHASKVRDHSGGGHS